MNVQKLIVLVIAIVINVIALALFNAATPVPGIAAVRARDGDIPTLPVIEVHPSAAQMRAVRRACEAGHLDRAEAASGAICAATPSSAFPRAGMGLTQE